MLEVGVIGAGAVGCWIGGRLAAQGSNVRFIGRERQRAELAGGLELRDLDGSVVRASSVDLASDPAALAGFSVVLCCVKSGQTAEVAGRLASILRPGALVISMQNGVRNAEVLAAGLRGQIALGGIVGFNVLSKGEGKYQRATSGPLVIEAHPGADALVAALRAAGLEALVSRDIRGLQWAKLIMNLNNAVSALSGAPTKVLLETAGYRRILGAVMAESLGVMKRAGITPAKLGAIPVQMFPRMLALPTWLLKIAARAQLKVDPEARSSMWEDLMRGRVTEVDELNGEIVRLAESCGAEAPLNRRIVALVHRVESARAGSPNMSPEALARALFEPPGAG